MRKRELFKVEGDKIIRLRRSCPKCGEGVFLAEHTDRLSCGTCGYTEFKGKKDRTPEKPPKHSEKPAKVPAESTAVPSGKEPKQEEQPLGP
jgi:small subunit ribosomal protein S27Ae